MESPAFLETCSNQVACGVDVRALSIQRAMEISGIVNSRPVMDDFILFDGKVSYEMSVGGEGLTTTLRSNPAYVDYRLRQFSLLWDGAMIPDLNGVSASG